MDEPATCPRGHEVAAAATRCTVCGSHVVPSAPNPFDPPARTPARHRRPRSWRQVRIAPIVGALIVVAVVAGWVVGGRFLTTPGDPVAAGTAPSAVAVPQAGTVASPTAVPTASPAVPAPVTAAPATSAPATSAPTVSPVPSSSPPTSASGSPPVDGCTVSGPSTPTACSPSGDLVTFGICVPSGATDVEVRTRKDADAPWKAPADKADLQGRGACATGQVEAQVTIKVKEGLTKTVRVRFQDGPDQPRTAVTASVTRADS